MYACISRYLFNVAVLVQGHVQDINWYDILQTNLFVVTCSVS
jgi:hypothetical protein